MVSQTRAFKLPFIVPTLTRESSSPKDSYVVSICPSFIDVVIDFIKYFEWSRIFYLYDTDDGEYISFCQAFFSSFQYRFVFLVRPLSLSQNKLSLMATSRKEGKQ